jgi:hypothetical protein
MKKLFTIILLALCLNSTAKFRKMVEIKYQKEYGWSKYYLVEATFITGFELNRATGSYDYNSYSTYCVIWWGEGECSVIKLNYASCGYDAQPYCISYNSSLEGKDQNDTKWYICLTDYCY